MDSLLRPKRRGTGPQGKGRRGVNPLRLFPQTVPGVSFFPSARKAVLAFAQQRRGHAGAYGVHHRNFGQLRGRCPAQGLYPDKEVLSWERQATQARELKADPNADAAFVRTLAAVKGVPVQEMADRILANAESWEPVAAMLTAQRQLMEEAAYAAVTIAEVAAIHVGYTV